MIKNPDYKWNNKFWELKGVQTSLSLDHAIRRSVKQIKEKPGGIIIDISHYKDNKKGIIGVIQNRMNIYNLYHGIIIIKNKSKIESIYKY